MCEADGQETADLVAYLEGQASEEKAARLEEQLASDPRLADRLAFQARLSVLLDTWGRQEFHQAGFRRASRALRIAAGAAIASVAVAAVLGIGFWRPGGGTVLPRILRSSTGVQVERGGSLQEASPGLRLKIGDVIRIPRGAGLLLGYDREGTTIEAGADAELKIPTGKKALELRRGEVLACIAPQPAGTPFLLNTPQARIEVLGTRFLVGVRGEITWLEVWEGKVRISGAAGKSPLLVGAGQGAVVEAGRGPRLLEEPLGGSPGLRGEYFDDEDFTQPVLTRIDPMVDFTWGLGSPDPSMGPDSFSIRWTGWVLPERSGTYTFHVVSDDGVRLWIDGRLLIDDWKVRGTQERSEEIILEGGRPVSLRLEYFDRVAQAQVHLFWSGPGFRKELVPPHRLRAPR